MSNYSSGDAELLDDISNEEEVNSSLQVMHSNVNDTFEVLRIFNSHVADNGIVTCFAENEVGQEKAEFILEIHALPKIVHLSVEKKFYWCIYYQVIGFPKPRRIWYFNNQPLLSPMIKDLENVWTLSSPYLSDGCLQLERASQGNEGLYTLVASNSLGEVNRSIEAKFHKDPVLIANPTYVSPGKPPILTEPVEDESDYENTYNTPFTIATGLIAVVVVFALALTLLCFVHWKKRRNSPDDFISFFYCPRRRKKRRERIPLHSAQLIENPHYIKENQTEFSAELQYISREKISFIQTLGEGAFGRVFLGTADYLSADEPTTLVAVKTLKDSDLEDVRLDFEREAALLASLQHGNIIQLYGVSTDGEALMMLFEYMEYGDLNNFLRDRSPGSCKLDIEAHKYSQLSIPQLLHISCQISAGMEYLASQHFVHRDLATRNCLVGDELVVKIGDFGMSRDVYSTDYYRVGRHNMLPIRWMPPESILYRKFTTESDIWSFGVVLWEIFTLGKQPWYELNNHEVIQQVTSNKILPRPHSCPEEIYKLMQDCWHTRPQDRIPMRSVHAKLQEFCQARNNIQYLEIVH